ncbi:MAG TPA: hypothetical protein VKD25_01350 [Burkholderiales bacterium]|nr:hypothetical protein [Burkholderiales bacterium]
MIIHATVTVTGDKPMLGACEARLRRLLSAQFLKNEVTEHHGAQALCYDLKVEGGIPFPVFAQASQEFPDLEFAAEWVNVAAGEKGAATIVNGRVSRQTQDRIAARSGGEHPLYVEVTANGRLVLALTLLRVAQGEWRGYALASGRDALVRALRGPRPGDVELYATEGGPEWARVWRGKPPALEALTPPVAIDDAVFRELDQVARGFVADWIWFASAPQHEIAIERDRYARSGFEVGTANVRSARLHRLRADAGEGQPLMHSTLGAEDLWVKDFILATWARET